MTNALFFFIIIPLSLLLFYVLFRLGSFAILKSKEQINLSKKRRFKEKK